MVKIHAVFQDLIPRINYGTMNGLVLDGLLYYVMSSLIQIRSEKMGNFILYLRKYAEKLAQETIEDERKNSIVLCPCYPASLSGPKSYIHTLTPHELDKKSDQVTSFSVFSIPCMLHKLMK